MDFSDIANIRLYSQHLSKTSFQNPQELVRYMGAMQAQDYNMLKWAVGVRLPGTTDDLVEEAINKGKILRTHLLRPTWHLVAAEDIYWLLELTAPQIKTTMRFRHKQLGLTEELVSKSNATIEKALVGGRQLTRDELVTELEKAGIQMDSSRAAHLLALAELDAIVCSGAVQGKKQTYALLEERVPRPQAISREEALANLAQRYLSSHGPATLQDFVWWSGLSVTDARKAIEIVASQFLSETLQEQTYWFSESIKNAKIDQDSAYLLPAFDEFIISYRDRTAALSFENHTKAVSNNGVFWPVIVVNGQVIGTWKRSVKKKEVLVKTTFFGKPEKHLLPLIEQAEEEFRRFLGKEVKANL